MKAMIPQVSTTNILRAVDKNHRNVDIDLWNDVFFAQSDPTWTSLIFCKNKKKEIHYRIFQSDFSKWHSQETNFSENWKQCTKSDRVTILKDSTTEDPTRKYICRQNSSTTNAAFLWHVTSILTKSWFVSFWKPKSSSVYLKTKFTDSWKFSPEFTFYSMREDFVVKLKQRKSIMTKNEVVSFW